MSACHDQLVVQALFSDSSNTVRAEPVVPVVLPVVVVVVGTGLPVVAEAVVAEAVVADAVVAEAVVADAVVAAAVVAAVVAAAVVAAAVVAPAVTVELVPETISISMQVVYGGDPALKTQYHIMVYWPGARLVGMLKQRLQKDLSMFSQNLGQCWNPL